LHGEVVLEAGAEEGDLDQGARTVRPTHGPR
jgi:hypothetical protein